MIAELAVVQQADTDSVEEAGEGAGGLADPGQRDYVGLICIAVLSRSLFRYGVL